MSITASAASPKNRWNPGADRRVEHLAVGDDPPHRRRALPGALHGVDDADQDRRRAVQDVRLERQHRFALLGEVGQPGVVDVESEVLEHEMGRPGVVADGQRDEAAAAALQPRTEQLLLLARRTRRLPTAATGCASARRTSRSTRSSGPRRPVVRTRVGRSRGRAPGTHRSRSRHPRAPGTSAGRGRTPAPSRRASAQPCAPAAHPRRGSSRPRIVTEPQHTPIRSIRVFTSEVGIPASAA